MNGGESKRPQLSLDELHQLKWLLGGALALLAVWTVFYMDLEGWTLMAVTSVAAIACVIWPGLPARVPALVHTLAFPAIVLFFVGDLWRTAEVLPAMVRLDMLLLLYRCISYRQRRDDLQVIVLGLFLIVVAGVLTVSLAFALQILIYTGCALGFLLAITLAEAAEGNEASPASGLRRPAVRPAWAAHANWPLLFRRLREVADWRVVGLGFGLFAGVVGLSALLFLALPRFQFENSLFLDRLVSKKARTGFTDSIKIGDVSEIVQDTSVALSVDVSDRNEVPAAPYWRMLVLDQYDHGAFRLSTGLRLTSFARERTGTVVHGTAPPRLGPAVYWTFYLESGVSSYLPLAGPFEVLHFTETQNFRLGTDLGVVALRNEPVTMTAYRVEGLDTTGVLPDPNFAKRWRQHDANAARRGALQNQISVTLADQARLKQVVDEIEPGGNAAAATAGDFSARASEWLRKNHLYSLSPTIPAGEGDPLVRWMTSHEAGHCELFAGSLVLLARTAGLPARVVTGFRGGTWNAYSNNFTIRNSDAHAWAEVFDAAAGAWLREDALETRTSAQNDSAKGEQALAARSDRSWEARFDSLRVFWYRRIVNFDQQSQTETLKTVKEATQNLGRRLREKLERMAASAREWLAGPWDVGRVAKVLGVAAAVAALGWVWSVFGRGWWRRLRQRTGGRREDPVRDEAGRWLRRMAGGEAAGADYLAVVAELRRLRFGARETWREPEKIFRRARRVWREARRGRIRAA